MSKWGFDVADKQNLAIGLFATPIGEILYRKLCFNELKRIMVQMSGKEESVTTTCMRRERKSKDSL